MKIKKALIYFISFFSLSIMFSICYYLSYKNALKQFNENAVERNKELILSLENNGLLLSENQQSHEVADNTPANQNTNSNTEENIDNSNNTNVNNTQDSTGENINGDSVPVDMVTEVTVLPSTKYTLQNYDIKNGIMEKQELSVPSYLVGLNREGVIEYLHYYLQDLPWSEFEKGLSSFELIAFSEKSIVLRKTYNSDLVKNKFFLKSQNGFIVVYYSDQKTIHEYTEVSVDKLTQYEQLQLEEGIFVKDIDELYSALENYSS